MANLKELREERLRKVGELKKLGINPYPSKTLWQDEQGLTAAAAKHGFEDFQGKTFVLEGRIAGIRKFGKIAFIVLKDSSGELQLFLSDKGLKPLNKAGNMLGMSELPLLDSGDFIQVRGQLVKTQTGEISIEVNELRLLGKTLRSLPTKQEGFSNKEERLRRRYIDTNVNQDVYKRFIRRSDFWQATRQFLLDNHFIEINTPVLESVPGGADARPFVTHMDALDQDFYLRISHELPLKRLLGAGYTRVFDIGPRFRNENYSDEHLPEHVAMEWYAAYMDWEGGMKLTQALIRYIADKTWAERIFNLTSGHRIELGTDDEDWPKISFVKAIKEQYNLDVFESSMQQIKTRLKEANLEVEKSDNRARCIDKLWKKIRVDIAGPVFLVDMPAFMQPLAKLQTSDERLTEQFNLILGGTEVCKAYSELNDPQDQLQRFLEQQKLREAGDDEAQMLDIDFVEMLEYGMPPACGYGHSERLFWLLEGVSAREGVPFPQLRAEVDETTKKIYPDLFK